MAIVNVNVKGPNSKEKKSLQNKNLRCCILALIAQVKDLRLKKEKPENKWKRQIN